MPVTIRPIEQRDNAAIATIIRTSLKEFGAAKPGTVYFDKTTDALFELFQQPNAVYFIAEKDGKIIGGSGIFPTENLPEGYCELVKLYLSKDARGKGIGKQLMQICFDKAKAMGFTHAYLETMPELKMAVGLYEKNGFNYLTAPLGNSGHCGCDIWMLKEL
jgi:putative acetyltransferase